MCLVDKLSNINGIINKNNAICKINKEQYRAIYYYPEVKTTSIWIEDKQTAFDTLSDETVLDLFENI